MKPQPESVRRPRLAALGSYGMATGLVLAAAAAVAALVVITTEGTAPPSGGGPVAAPALPPPVGGSAAGSSPAPSSSGKPASTSPRTPDAASAARRTAPTGTPFAEGTLRPGDRGPAVLRLQQQLFQQGFTYVSPTGDYDAATTRGVTQLQQNRGLTSDPPGVYGPESRAALTSGN